MSGSRPAQLAQGTYAKHSIAHDSCFPCRNHQIIRVRHHSFPLSNRSSGSGSKSSKATWSLQNGYGAIQILLPWRTIGLYGFVPWWIPKTHQPQELRKMLKQKNSHSTSHENLHLNLPRLRHTPPWQHARQPTWPEAAEARAAQGQGNHKWRTFIYHMTGGINIHAPAILIWTEGYLKNWPIAI